LTGTNLNVASGSYLWVGTPVTSGIGLAENVSGVSGLIATSGGVVTQYIKSDGTFQLGKSGGSYLSFDGTTVALVNTNLTVGSSNYIWAGSGVGVTGCGFYSGGFAGYYNSDRTVFISGITGNFQFGKATGHNLTYITSTGELTINGMTFSDWANISGSNIPDQNATDGATWSSDITNQPADNIIITSQGTASNTVRVNDAHAESGYDLRMYNGADIIFYSDAGSTAAGSIASLSGTFQVQAVGYLSLSADKDIRLSPGTGYFIRCYKDMLPLSSTGYDLGGTSNKWDYVYANYLGTSGTKITSGYITTVNTTTVNAVTLNATSNTATEQITCQKNKVYLGGSSANRFHIYLWQTDETYVGHFKGYITSS